MFDTIAGLPLHVLVVHAVVVLLPLMALVTLYWAWRPQFPARAGWMVVAADALVAVLTLVAKESGESLQHRLGGAVAQEHAELGAVLPFMAFALLFAAALLAGVRSGPAGMPRAVPGALVSVVVVVAVVWTVRVGHSGAEAVWGGMVPPADR